jgi:hypothetical protein
VDFAGHAAAADPLVRRGRLGAATDRARVEEGRDGYVRPARGREVGGVT